MASGRTRSEGSSGCTGDTSRVASGGIRVGGGGSDGADGGIGGAGGTRGLCGGNGEALGGGGGSMCEQGGVGVQKIPSASTHTVNLYATTVESCCEIYSPG
ncbi:unnamed protein product [Allacma fusca]|uniref:Uncharacterized protein n=1 Tax=Allacma fusca TaxID=39272 RepID=A0A8J2P3N3_9HEXA|nr:unnamed protein product [Allacma fusca]